MKAVLTADYMTVCNLTHHLGDGWEVLVPFQALTGRRYDLLLVPANLYDDLKVCPWLKDVAHLFTKIVRIG